MERQEENPQRQTESSTRRKELRIALRDAIDGGLCLLGDAGRDAMYYQAEKRFNLNREEIPDRLYEFHNALDRLFGFGAIVIEKNIARRLFNSLGLTFVAHDDWTISEYVEEVRREVQSNSSVL